MPRIKITLGLNTGKGTGFFGKLDGQVEARFENESPEGSKAPLPQHSVVDDEQPGSSRPLQAKARETGDSTGETGPKLATVIFPIQQVVSNAEGVDAKSVANPNDPRLTLELPEIDIDDATWQRLQAKYSGGAAQKAFSSAEIQDCLNDVYADYIKEGNFDVRAQQRKRFLNAMAVFNDAVTIALLANGILQKKGQVQPEVSAKCVAQATTVRHAARKERILRGVLKYTALLVMAAVIFFSGGFAGVPLAPIIQTLLGSATLGVFFQGLAEVYKDKGRGGALGIAVLFGAVATLFCLLLPMSILSVPMVLMLSMAITAVAVWSFMAINAWRKQRAAKQALLSKEEPLFLQDDPVIAEQDQLEEANLASVEIKTQALAAPVPVAESKALMEDRYRTAIKEDLHALHATLSQTADEKRVEITAPRLRDDLKTGRLIVFSPFPDVLPGHEDLWYTVLSAIYQDGLNKGFHTEFMIMDRYYSHYHSYIWGSDARVPAGKLAAFFPRANQAMTYGNSYAWDCRGHNVKAKQTQLGLGNNQVVLVEHTYHEDGDGAWQIQAAHSFPVVVYNHALHPDRMGHRYAYDSQARFQYCKDALLKICQQFAIDLAQDFPDHYRVFNETTLLASDTTSNDRYIIANGTASRQVIYHTVYLPAEQKCAAAIEKCRVGCFAVIQEEYNSCLAKIEGRIKRDSSSPAEATFNAAYTALKIRIEEEQKRINGLKSTIPLPEMLFAQSYQPVTKSDAALTAAAQALDAIAAKAGKLAGEITENCQVHYNPLKAEYDALEKLYQEHQQARQAHQALNATTAQHQVDAKKICEELERAIPVLKQQRTQLIMCGMNLAGDPDRLAKVELLSGAIRHLQALMAKIGAAKPVTLSLPPMKIANGADPKAIVQAEIDAIQQATAADKAKLEARTAGFRAECDKLVTTYLTSDSSRAVFDIQRPWFGETYSFWAGKGPCAMETASSQAIRRFQDAMPSAPVQIM